MPSSFTTPWIIALQVPLSMGFPRQEHWSRLPFPFPGDLQRSNLYPLHCRWILWLLSYQETSFRGLHLWRGFILSSLFKRAQGLSPAQHMHENSSHHPVGFVFWNFLLAPLPYPPPPAARVHLKSSCSVFNFTLSLWSKVICLFLSNSDI